MINSCIVSTKCPIQKHNNILNPIHRTFIIIILVALVMILTSCIADHGVYLNFDNQIGIDVKMVYSQYYKSGSPPTTYTLGVVPAGQTVKLATGIVGGIGAAPKVIILAEDSSGNVVWQKIWTGEEFGKLVDSGPLNIIISPETSN